MRILLINQYAGSPNLGMEYRPHWMATEWQKLGLEVLIVAGDHSHLRRAQPPVGRSTVEGVDFLTLRTPRYGGNGPRRFMNILGFRVQLQRSSRMLRNWRPDVVIASSTHPMDVRPAAAIAAAAEARLAYEIHDLWPLTPRLLGGMSRYHPMIAWMQREEDYGYRNADAVLSLLPGTEDYARSHGMREGSWTYAPNGVQQNPGEALLPPAHLAALNALQVKFPRTIAFAGGHAPVANLESLLDHSDWLADMGISVVLVGDGPIKSDLVSRYSAKQNVLFLEPITREAIPAFLRQCHAGYVGGTPIALYRYGISPNKLFDYLASAIPVIENVSQEASLVETAQCGFVADPYYPSTLSEVLGLFAETPNDELAELGRRGQQYLTSGLTQAEISLRVAEALSR